MIDYIIDYVNDASRSPQGERGQKYGVFLLFLITQYVALRKESVDRNSLSTPINQTSSVALRKESVDRNGPAGAYPPNRPGSLSARRAWIEIYQYLSQDFRRGCRSPQGERGQKYKFFNLQCLIDTVALRKESVDRNRKSKTEKPKLKTSLSARRAWIEILNIRHIQKIENGVALRKESVDRNAVGSKALNQRQGRSPQGERGQKFDYTICLYRRIVVALRKESVDRNGMF